jgi:hypothetical protein
MKSDGQFFFFIICKWKVMGINIKLGALSMSKIYRSSICVPILIQCSDFSVSLSHLKGHSLTLVGNFTPSFYGQKNKAIAPTLCALMGFLDGP